jgi:hypothetical protein
MAVTTTLTAVLRPKPFRIIFTFAVLGAAVHQVTRTVEIDNRLRILLATYLATALSLFSGYLYLFSIGWLRATASTMLI